MASFLHLTLFQYILTLRIRKIDIFDVSMQKNYSTMNRYIALQKVVEAGSFTKAAELLGYTQPALSQMIASL